MTPQILDNSSGCAHASAWNQHWHTALHVVNSKQAMMVRHFKTLLHLPSCCEWSVRSEVNPLLLQASSYHGACKGGHAHLGGTREQRLQGEQLRHDSSERKHVHLCPVHLCPQQHLR